MKYILLYIVFIWTVAALIALKNYRKYAKLEKKRIETQMEAVDLSFAAPGDQPVPGFNPSNPQAPAHCVDHAERLLIGPTAHEQVW